MSHTHQSKLGHWGFSSLSYVMTAGFAKVCTALRSFTQASQHKSIYGVTMGLPSILVRVFGLTVMAD
ncbi:MAG: hypothetical protein V9E91_04195 [Burkholderiaceae bacterium]